MAFAGFHMSQFRQIIMVDIGLVVKLMSLQLFGIIFYRTFVLSVLFVIVVQNNLL